MNPLGTPTLDPAFVIGWHVGKFHEAAQRLAEQRASEAQGRMAA